MTSPLARFAALFILPNTIFFVLAYLLPVQHLLVVLNGLAIAVATGVVIAYAPAVLDMFSRAHGKIDRTDLLAAGIFVGWFALIWRSSIHFWWRHLGEPHGYLDSYWLGYVIFLMICGAVFHLLAPGTIDSRIPPKQWAWLGGWVAIGAIGLLALSWMSGLLAPYPHEN